LHCLTFAEIGVFETKLSISRGTSKRFDNPRLACVARDVSIAPGEGAAEPGVGFPIQLLSVRSTLLLSKRTGDACSARSGRNRARHTTFRFAPRGAIDTSRAPHAQGAGPPVRVEAAVTIAPLYVSIFNV